MRRVVERARGTAAVEVGVVGAVHHLGAAHRHAAGGRRARPMPAGAAARARAPAGAAVAPALPERRRAPPGAPEPAARPSDNPGARVCNQRT